MARNSFMVCFLCALSQKRKHHNAFNSCSPFFIVISFVLFVASLFLCLLWLILTPFLCPDKHSHNHGRIREQHRGPRAPAIDVFDQIKHARWEVDQHREKAENEKPSQKLCEPRRPAQWREGECIPDHLKQDHIHKNANIAKHFALRMPQKLETRRLLWRREISIDKERLHDRTDQSQKNDRNKDRAIV